MPECLSAVSRALTNAQARAITRRFTRLNPHWEGSAVMDILEALADSDSDLDQIEPFYKANPGLLVEGAAYAARALIWSGQELTAEALRGLLVKAGLVTEYYEGVPILPPARAREVADRLRIRIIGVRAGWSAWAAREADIARCGLFGDSAAEKRWEELMVAYEALRQAELSLETAIKHIAKEVPDARLG